MLISCFSSKGGVGTTVVAAALGIVLAAREPTGALLVDMAGDVPSALGVSDGTSMGLADWLAAGSSVPADALGRLEIPVACGLTLLPRGKGPLDARRAGVLARLFTQAARPVVVDCGRLPPDDWPAARGAREMVALAADQSLLVTRSCRLSLRRLDDVTPRPTGAVVVREPGRRMARREVEHRLGVPVVAEVDLDPAVARAVDDGLLSEGRLPRTLARGLRDAA